MNPGLQLGPLHVYYYGLILAAAVWLAYLVVRRRARTRGLPSDAVDTLFIWTVPLGVLGGRLYFVLLNLERYLAAPGRILAVWEGGMAIHGALVGGLVGLLVGYRLAKRRHPHLANLRVAVLLDLVAPALLAAQAVGRLANFVNQEAFGVPTALPWGIPIDPVRRPPEFASATHFHPTFAYEALWNVLGLVLLLAVERRWRRRYGAAGLDQRAGALFALYVLWYSIGRTAIEGLRTDSLYLGPLRAAQVVGVIAAVGALGYLWYRSRTWRRSPSTPLPAAHSAPAPKPGSSSTR
ncbi:MAG: prolipoprotein diacylglyceryl transferase [Candidatus Andersenbacteria bacterium]